MEIRRRPEKPFPDSSQHSSIRTQEQTSKGSSSHEQNDAFPILPACSCFALRRSPCGHDVLTTCILPQVVYGKGLTLITLAAALFL